MNKNLFNSIQVFKPKGNVFDLSHDVKTSMKMGYLYPTLALECVPGDRFNIGCDSLMRFQPMITPPIHRFDVTMHYFFVPNRLLWDDWESFITGTAGTGVHPFFDVDTTNYEEGGLLDHFGIPTPINGETERVNALPIAAMLKIYDDYYRDQNLITPKFQKLVNGDNTSTLASVYGVLRKRAWEHDYFTSALPSAQQGNPVALPIAEFNDVPVLLNDANGTVLDGTPLDVTVDNSPNPDLPTNTLFAETSQLNNTPTTINDLRRAFRLQEWLEKNMRAGVRYIENILMHFGVRSSDKRLQRPEYITGTKSPVVISEVLNMTGTEDAPQGSMAGHGVSVTQGKYGSYFCEEHGFIIGVMSILPKTAYQQGLDKMWLKFEDPFQYYWPSFAHIGEQEVLNKEVYAFQGATGDDTFGYVPRYAEYKFMQSRVSSDLRSSLNFWHAGRIFEAPPALNQDFVEADPTTRFFAVEEPTIDKLIVHIYHKIRAFRPMPKFGTPTF